MLKSKSENRSPARLLFIAAGSIFLAETAIEIILPRLPPLTPLARVLVDSTLLSAALFPMLFFLMFRPLLLNMGERNKSQAELQRAHADLQVHTAQLQEHNRQTALLREMANLFQSCPSAEEAYHVIAEYCQRLSASESGALYVFNASRNLVEMVAKWGVTAPGEDAFVPDACWALRRGQIHIVDQAQSALSCRHLTHSGQLAYMCIPMMAQGDTLGVLSLYNTIKPGEPNSGCLTESKQQLALSVAEQVALALANLNLRETLRRQAIRDPLTHLFNRRFMEETLERELDRARRKRTTVAVVMLDIDHFKQFNDTYGHEAGDRLLSELGLCIRSHVRGEDVACRYGGEEFTLILPDCPLRGAEEHTKELQERIRLLRVKYFDQSLSSITISCGIALFPEHGGTPDALLRVADVALYQAKRQGRDRIVIGHTGAESTVEIVH